MLRKYFGNLVVGALIAACVLGLTHYYATDDVLFWTMALFAAIGFIWFMALKRYHQACVLGIAWMLGFALACAPDYVHASSPAHVMLDGLFLFEAGIFAILQQKGKFALDQWFAAYNPLALFCVGLSTGDHAVRWAVTLFVLSECATALFAYLIWRAGKDSPASSYKLSTNPLR